MGHGAWDRQPRGELEDSALPSVPFRRPGGLARAGNWGNQRRLRRTTLTLELYWTGVRDYCAQERLGRKGCEDRLVEGCRRLFPDLRAEVTRWRGFNPLSEWNYEIFSEERRNALANNLFHTEIDIVLESPQCLYIGEAKYESRFGGNGKLVLVHQLIRQYVMAKVLVDIVGCDRRIVPFIVEERPQYGEAKQKGEVSQQVAFMIDRGWLDPKHVLTWDSVARLSE